MQHVEVVAAAGRLLGRLRHTPVLALDAELLGIGQPVQLKLDVLQPTGSFKVRGATSLLTGSEVPDAGVVAASGGNFGLGIAWAAARLGVAATIVAPASAPAAKLAPIRALGATLRLVDGAYADALAVAEELLARTGALAAHAYDDRLVVAGQGTAALELLADAPVDTVLVACGGGGLLAGTVAAVEGRARVVAVETEGTPTLSAALDAGRPVDVEVGGLAASALGARRIGTHAWAVHDRLAGSLLVTDAEVAATQRWLWARTRLVAEPGGAVALAALLHGRYRPAPDERVGVLVCGANTDPATVATDG
ncbi:MAG: serine/threonine dehydratase [Nitriliruptoraceae bacterium]